MIVRRIVAMLAALLLAIQVVRNAVVLSLSGTQPAESAKIWSDHPTAELSLAMMEIAEATRFRRPVPLTAFELTADAARKEPLAPEPFLVRGVQAQIAGNEVLAERAFEAAQWREPRSLPAAYFLADRYFRAGNVRGGLGQVAALARLSPGGSATIGPYIAAYAQNRSNWPQLKSLLTANPALAGPALNVLAANVATTEAVLALADRRTDFRKADWFVRLLRTLVSAGEVARARTIWAEASRPKSGELIHDSTFSDKLSPAPFNWDLASSPVGLAERQPGGRLHVMFYGQEDGVLASQLLLLPPGIYRLSMRVVGDGDRASSLNWSIWCDKAAAPIASVTLDAAARGWRFKVPTGCSAQWLKLSGASGDISQQVDETIAGLKLERVQAGA